MNIQQEDFILLLILFCIGSFIELAKSFAREESNWKTIIAKAILNGFSSLSTAAILLWIPDIQVLPLVGISAIVGTLGTEYLVRIIKNYIKNKTIKEEK
ncbi:hypothetical protein [Acinetobacter seifertii]|uniref:hypothetical protein n=1 Tax=Acinetobacter seifertii TaxID=1530123 RepID=UPI003862C0E7